LNKIIHLITLGSIWSCGAKKINSAETPPEVKVIKIGKIQNLGASPKSFAPTFESRLNGSFEEPILQETFARNTSLWELKDNQWTFTPSLSIAFKSDKRNEDDSSLRSWHFTSSNSAWLFKKNGVVWEDLSKPQGQQYAEVGTLELIKENETPQVLLALRNQFVVKIGPKVLVFTRAENTLKAVVFSLPPIVLVSDLVSIGNIEVAQKGETSSKGTEMFWAISKEFFFSFKNQPEKSGSFKGTKMELQPEKVGTFLHLLSKESTDTKLTSFWILSSKGVFKSL
jgi:hypothetical protein